MQTWIDVTSIPVPVANAILAGKATVGYCSPEQATEWADRLAAASPLDCDLRRDVEAAAKLLREYAARAEREKGRVFVGISFADIAPCGSGPVVGYERPSRYWSWEAANA